MGGANCSSVLKENVSSLANQMMEFLPRRLAVRYLLSRKRRERYEYFHADVICVSVLPASSRPCQLLLLRHSIICDRGLEDYLRLSFDEASGNVVDIKRAVSEIIGEWDEKTNKHQHFKCWLEPREFVGVLKIGDEDLRTFPGYHELFTFYHAFLADRIVRHAKMLSDAEKQDTSLFPYANLVGRMNERFGAFAAQSRHLAIGTFLGE